MRIGVIGAMQIEVDNLKASMSDIGTKDTAWCGLCVRWNRWGQRNLVQQCVESARCLPQSVRRQ